MSDYAKEVFAATLEHLLNQHQLSNITVSLLAKESGLSRRTFYNNYIDIYDFIFSVHFMRTQNFRDSFWEDRDFYTATLLSLHTIKKYHKFYKNLVKIQGPDSFINSLISFLMGINPKLIEHPIHKDLEFCLELYWSGYAYKLCRWIEHDMDIPPEKFVHMLGNSVPEQLKPYFYLNLCT